MKRTKQKRPSEQRFPITFESVPVQTLRGLAKTYLAFRGVEYHFGRNIKNRFLEAASIGRGQERNRPRGCVIVNPDHSIAGTAERLCLVDFLNLLVANEPSVTRRIS